MVEKSPDRKKTYRICNDLNKDVSKGIVKFDSLKNSCLKFGRVNLNNTSF